MELAGYIDHTLLKADATEDDISRLCAEAREYGFKSVCVTPSFVSTAREALKGTGVRVCTVIGFPLGASTTPVKVYEASDAIKKGADEIDMVMNIGRLRSGDIDYVKDDIGRVVAAMDEFTGIDGIRDEITVKVIIETCLLTDEEIRAASLAVKEAGAGFVKTSTGFSTGGATVEAVRLIRETVGPDMGIKASGGIRTKEDALAMIEAGATRIGTSNGVGICCNN